MRLATFATAGTMAAVLPLAGCAKPYPLHARMNEESVQAVLDANFEPGMRLAEVEHTLTELRVGEDDRVRYNIDERPSPVAEPETTAPPQLLARVYEAGGFWLDDQDDYARITDLIFVFDDDLRLNDTDIQRYRLRYFDNALVNPLPYEPAYRPRRWPHKPPPPKHPPVGPGEENAEGAEETQSPQSSGLD